MADTYPLVWDKSGERYYETGVKKGVLYPRHTDGTYPKGIPWNGLTGVTESPSGAEASNIYADDTKYGVLRSAEEFGATITAYTYPDEFAACDGTVTISKGLKVGQQARQPFGFSYVTTISNDLAAQDYLLHIVYNATASPSERAYATINESPEAITFSWTVTTTPVEVNAEGIVSTCCLTLDSRKLKKETMAAVEELLYGKGSVAAKLPMPGEIITLIKTKEA